MLEKLDRVRGCLVGGAAGDALGYAVEFSSLESIRCAFGENGIQSYQISDISGKAEFSDDTQMTLFTATGILSYQAAVAAGEEAALNRYIALSYGDWLVTQSYKPEDAWKAEQRPVSWLREVTGLYSRRAPGLTCLSALLDKERYSVKDFINTPVNDSKGCGGVMRVAPLALVPWENIEKLDREAAEAAAITHSHPLGYLPAAVLCHVINRIVYPVEQPVSLRQIIMEAKETVCRIFAGARYLPELEACIDMAVELAGNQEDDVSNIRKLGAGWVGEEALAIALYCALRYEHDFDACLIASVNHSGDSDSTGAIAGNIVGALIGYENISDSWKNDLELLDVILSVADNLAALRKIS